MNERKSRKPLKKKTASVARAFQNFFSHSAASGVILVVFAALAVVWSNSGLSADYFSLLSRTISIGSADFGLSGSLQFWVNDCLMAIFFLAVGLEIKREILIGELSTVRKAILPMAGALGGMIFPALIYASFAASGEFSNGWGIPVATDIAFALGVLALLGQRIPLGLKVFLAALAIADDLGAVAVIAIFYSHGLSVAFLLSSCFVVLLLLLGNRFTIRSSWFYAVLGVVLWCFVLKSGIHATVAGVLLAMTIPVKSGGGQSESEIERISLLERWEHTLQPLVSYLILPVFALVNTGILLQGLDIAAVFCNSVTVGIMLGLVVGKVAGVSLFVWLAVKLRIASLPSNVSMTNIFGVSWLCGIGFTMSLFIAGLAFGESWIMNNAKIGIFSASILAGIIGYVVLRLQFTSKTGAMS